MAMTLVLLHLQLDREVDVGVVACELVGLQPLHHSHMLRSRTRSEVQTGPSRRCWSLSAKNGLNGMVGIILTSPLSPSSCMEPQHGERCWRVAWVLWVSGHKTLIR